MTLKLGYFKFILELKSIFFHLQFRIFEKQLFQNRIRPDDFSRTLRLVFASLIDLITNLRFLGKG